MFTKKYIYFLVLIVSIFLVASCSLEPKAIQFGEENCDFCQMTISDERYGAEIVTSKGRIYKFDDLHCLKEFLYEGRVAKDNIHSKWVVDFDKKKELIEVEKSFLLFNDILRSPMGSNTAAFTSEEVCDRYFEEYDGTKMTWKEFFTLE